MRSFIVLSALAAVFVASPAFAGVGNGSCPPPFDFLCGGDDDQGETPGQNVDVDVDVDNHNFNNNINHNEASASAEAGAFQTQGQGQHQSQGNEQSIVFEDKVAASPAASLYLGTCQAGMSAQTLQGGGSLGSPDEVCLLFTAAQVASTQGRETLANKLLDEAVDILRIRSNPVRRFLQGVPLLGRVM